MHYQINEKTITRNKFNRHVFSTTFHMFISNDDNFSHCSEMFLGKVFQMLTELRPKSANESGWFYKRRIRRSI